MTLPTQVWPDLGSIDIKPTTDALHLWSQIIGKIRLMTTPWENHSWHVPLYVSASGLTSGMMTVDGRAFSLEFDFIREWLILRNSNGSEDHVALVPQNVAAFFAATMQMLDNAGIHIALDCVPCEIEGGIAFDQDHAPRAYDAEVARQYWRALIQVQRVFQRFRTRFIGKCSPIHLFWGSFDLAVTRFSGRDAPLHPGGAPHTPNSVMQDAYLQEVSSAGFWPGGGAVPSPCFYSYAYPTPAGFGDASAGVAQPAYFDQILGEYLLSYQAVTSSSDPDATLLTFLQQTYEAAANLSGWDRARLERAEGEIGAPPPGS